MEGAHLPGMPGPGEGQSWADYIRPGAQGILSGLGNAGQFLADMPSALAYGGRRMLLGQSPDEAMYPSVGAQTKGTEGALDTAFSPAPYRSPAPGLTGAERQRRYSRSRLPQYMDDRASQEAIRNVIRQNRNLKSMFGAGSGAEPYTRSPDDMPADVRYDPKQDPRSGYYEAPGFADRASGTLGNLKYLMQHALSPSGAPAPERSNTYPYSSEQLPPGWTTKGWKQEGELEGLLRKLRGQD